MTEPIYLTAFRESVKRPDYETTKSTDPDYLAFRNAIQSQAARNDFGDIKESKIHTVWYYSNTFREHWNTASKTAGNGMLWTAFHSEWTYDEGGVLTLAWFKHHHRKVTPEDIETFQRKVAKPCWDQCQPDIIAARKRKNEKRKAKRAEKRSMNAPKLKLHTSILECLKNLGKATTLELERELLPINPEWTAKRIESHLYRMSHVEVPEVTKIVRGVYALPARERV